MNKRWEDDSKIREKVPPHNSYLALVMYDNLTPLPRLMKSNFFSHKDGYLGPHAY